MRTIEAAAGAIRKLYRNLHTQTIDEHAEAAGIAFVLVRTWRGRDGRFEKRLKNQKHHSRLCPFCNPAGYAKRTTRMHGD